MLTWLATLAVVATTAGNLHVVAVGVETYEDKSITPLKFAVADARAIADTFRAGGVPGEFVTVLTSDQTDAASRPTRDRLIAALQAVRDQAQADDRLVFFFAGHGVEQDGKQYLYTADTRPDLLVETALPMALVARALEGIKARQVLFIVDACRNDPRAARGDADAVMTEGMARGLRLKLNEVGGQGPQVAVLLSCDAGQRAWEDPASGHGLFTAALLKGIMGKGADVDGVIRLEPLALYVQEEVARMAAAQQREQRPSFSNPGGKEIELLRPMETRRVTLTFDQTPLGTVVRQLGDAYGAQIVLGQGADPAAAITGRVGAQLLDIGLRELFGTGDLDWSRQGDVITVWSWEARKPPGWPTYLKWPPVRDPALQFKVSPKDGMPQVLVPAGEFVMGSPYSDPERQSEERPQRRVYVSAFWMDVHEVTVGQFRKFREATGQDVRWDERLRRESHEPVVEVFWEEAQAYAEWVGRRLPTEAQWEKAARAGTTTIYPWGNKWDADRANDRARRRTEGYKVETVIQPVGTYAPNRYGLFDLIGNAWEVCRDWYDEEWYRKMPERDPVNTTPSYFHVLRGGSYFLRVLPVIDLRVAGRSEESIAASDVYAGFRCVEEP